MAKHVIILGAGASWTSGYPLGARLREILSSARGFERFVDEELGDLELKAESKSKLLQVYARFADTEGGRLLQKGDYASVDEFCFLLRKNTALRALTRSLKWFTALVFAVHDPEQPGQDTDARPGHPTSNAAPSDYRRFVQKLFNAEIHELRDDIAILTYNYDPYLEFVLSREFVTRKKAAGRAATRIPTSLLSGFSDGNAEKIQYGNGFCLLKLHGTSVIPSLDPIGPGVTSGRMSSVFTFANVFLNRRAELPSALRDFNETYHRPPTICFPWELLTDNGNFRRELPESQAAGIRHRLDEYKGRTPDHRLFSAIWKRAQREIAGAEKVSFIGISAHHFFEGGIRFLFKAWAKRVTSGGEARLQVVIANSDPHAPGQIERLLKKACPTIALGDVTRCTDFADFIQREM